MIRLKIREASHGLGKVFALESLLIQSCDSPKEDSIHSMDLMMHLL